ncbi:MAG TPA: hypothetical protein VMW69_03680 [Spirochaetia bacterium]|nr:hypothetical protein [Spirochaetia bacterium]
MHHEGVVPRALLSADGVHLSPAGATTYAGLVFREFERFSV